MKNIRKILAWFCTFIMLFSNVSMTAIAVAELAEEIMQEAGTVPVEEESTAPETREPENIKVGDSRRIRPDTSLLLHAAKEQEIVVLADVPVTLAVQHGSEQKTYQPRDGKLEAIFTVVSGDYLLTFSGTEQEFKVQILDAEEYRAANTPQAEDSQPEAGEAEDGSGTETEGTGEDQSIVEESGEDPNQAEESEEETGDNQQPENTPEEEPENTPDEEPENTPEPETEPEEKTAGNPDDENKQDEEPEGDLNTENNQEDTTEGELTEKTEPEEEPGENPVKDTEPEETPGEEQVPETETTEITEKEQGATTEPEEAEGNNTTPEEPAQEEIPAEGQEAEEPAEDTGSEPDEEEAQDEEPAPEEELITDFTCTLQGAQDISLTEVITDLGIMDADEAADFLADVENIEATNPDVITVVQTEDDWILRVVKESEDQEAVTISMPDETVYTITAETEGIKEVATEDETAVISTVNDLYLPEDANAYADALTDAQGEEAISAVLDLPEEGEQTVCQVFDIGLENVNAEEYEGFEISVSLDEELAGKDFRLYQVQDGTATDLTDTLQLDSSTNKDGTESVSGFTFTTDQFTQFVLCYTLETYFTTFDGTTFDIRLDYDQNAGIPENADLKVREILPEDEEYEAYYSQALRTINAQEETEEQNTEDIATQDRYARFFDIEIWADGQKIEPTGQVSVSISLADMPDSTDGELKVVHFDEDGPVVLDAEISDNNEILFETDGFSVYAVITVPDQPTGVEGLDGRAFTISYSGNYMTKNIVGSNPAQLESTTEEDDVAVWQFEKTETAGEYYIFTFVDGVKKYLNLGAISDDRYSKGNISDTPQAFTVGMENNSYVFSTTVGEKTHYLRYRWMDNSVGFSGSEWNVNESKLTLGFIQPTTTNEQDYILVTQYEGEYYVILNDGTLEKTQLSDPQTLKIDDPMVWHYTGNNLYHHAKETGFDEFNLACDYYYRYLDPDVSSALTQEDIDTTTGHPEGIASIYRIDSRPYMNQIKINYSGNKINSQTNPSNYIGIVRDENGNLKIAGKQSEASAATIYFARVIDGELVYTRDNAIHHTVNHIDISIVGRVAISAPLAYGTYYYKDDNGQVQTLVVSRENPVTIDVSQNVDIEGDDIKRATITTFTIDPDDPTKHNPIDDVFYITGYSGNHETGESANQTRIEGVFKVADLPSIDKNDPEQWDAANNRPTQAILDARLENPIYYTVSTTKPISFDLEYNGKKLYQSSETAEAGGSDGIAKGSATVTLGQTFNYWDSRNECPGINRDNWKNGGIDYGWSESTGAGMDFALGTVDKDKTGVLAIEITKYIVDKAGNAITPLDDVDNVFHIYRSPAGKTSSYNSENGNAVHYTDEVIGLDVDRWTEDYSGYDSLYKLVHDKTLTVGDGGMGTIYDYDVAAGMIYIEEDKSERNLPRTLEDVNGKNWTYIGTQLETEYVWRDNGIEYRKHVSKTYSDEDEAYRSIPEVLGDYQDVNGLSRYNGFLEFYVYNIYDAEPIDISVKKEWKHQNGSNAEAPEGASVTVTLGRFKLVEDTDHPVNGTLIINHTVTETTENPDGHYYATYKVKQGNRVLRSGSYDGQNSQAMTGLPAGNYAFEITESVNGYTSATTLNGQQTTSIPITITVDQETVVNVNTTLEETAFAALVNLHVTNSINGAENYYDHTFTFPSGSKIIVTVNRPGDSYKGGGFQARFSGGLGSGEVPWPDNGGYSNVDQDLEFVLPTVQETTTIELNFWHEWGPESFTIKSVTLAKTEASTGNGTQNTTASTSSVSGGRSLQSGKNTTAVTRGSIGQTGNNPTSTIPGMKYVDDESWSTAETPVQVTLANGIWENVVRDLPAVDENGHPYLYYIRNVDETGMPEGTVSVIVIGEDGKVLASNGQTVLRVTNTIPNEKPKITLKKTDENGIPLPGAQFGLSQTVNETTSTQDITISSADGTYVTGELEDGSYSIYELTAPDGYKPISGTINFNVEGMAVSVQENLPGGVTFDGTDYSFTIKNEPVTDSGKLKVSKRWLDFYGNATNSTEESVQLKLIQYAQNESPKHIVRVQFQYQKNDGSWETVATRAERGSGAAEIKWSWKSGAQPTIQIVPEELIVKTETWFSNLVTYDNVYLYANTVNLEQDVTFLVKASYNGENPYNEIFTPDFKGPAGLGEGYSPTGGSRTFTLNSENNWTMSFDYQGNSDAVLTDGGTVLPATYMGRPCKYIATEESVPAGYAVSYSGNNDGLGSGDNAAITVYNRKTSLDIKLIKVDESDHTKKLQNATFEIRKLDASKPGVSYQNGWAVQTETTDADGIAWFRNLTEGYYEIKETQAPNEHYYIPEGEGTFYIRVTTDGLYSIEKNETKYVSSWSRRTNDSMLTMNADGSFTVGNRPRGALTITKSVTVDDDSIGAGETSGKKNLADGTYSFTITGPGEYSSTGTITVTDGAATNSIVRSDLIPGDYTITEDVVTNGTALSGRTGGLESGDRGITLTVNSGSTAAANTAAFTNNINTTSLKVSKTIVSPIPTDSTNKTFTFTVEIKKPDRTPLTGTFDSDLSDGNNGTVAYTFDENGRTTVTTTGTQAVKISGLPQGATYTVTETTDSDFDVTDPEIDTTSNTYKQSGTLGTTTATAAFTNTRKTGSLVITKNLQGKDGDAVPDGTYTYPVKVTTEIDNKTYYVAQNGDSYTLTETVTTLYVTNKERLTLINLPLGNGSTSYIYKVEEVNPSSVAVTGYTNVTVDNTTVESVDNITLNADTAANAGLVNVYELTRMTISKAMNVGTSTENFSFIVEVKDNNNTAYTGTAWLDAGKTQPITFNSEGKYKATVQAGKSITIYGLPAGYTYKVTEEEKDGYLLVSVNGGSSKTEATGIIGKGLDAFVNKEVVDVSVDKIWLNSDNSALDWPAGVIVPVVLINGTTKEQVATCELYSGENPHTSHTFTNLDKYDENGNLINYTVAETGVSFVYVGYYDVSVSGDMTSGLHITNKLKPGALKITKAITVNGGDVSEVITGKKNLADGEYKFTITGPKGYTENKAITVTNGVAADSVELTGLVPGEYVITEAENTNGTMLSGRSGGTDSGDRGIRITVTPGSTVTDHVVGFTNNIETTTLTINKAVVSPISTDSTTQEFSFTVKVTKPDRNPLTGTFGDYTFDSNGETTVTTTGNDSKTIPDLPQGATYTITETTDGGYTQEAVIGASGTLTNTPATAAFSNTRKTGSLVITKELKGNGSDAAPEGTYTYPIRVTTTIGGIKYYVAQNGSSWALTTTETTLNVTNGTPLTLTNLPIQDGDTPLTYTVTEIEPGNVAVAGYTNVQVGGTTAETVTAAPGTTANPGTANLVNVYKLTQLTIRKSMEAGTSTESFNFMVEVKDSEGAAYNGDAWLDAGKTQKITFVNGQYIASVQAGSSKTIYGLPAGYTYKITEQDQEGYQLVSVDDDSNKTESTGTINEAGNTAAFVNREVVKVSVEKTWKNSDGSDLAWPDGAIVTVALKNGETEVATCKLTGSNPVHTKHTFENLPKYDGQGNAISYTVVETNVTIVNRDHYAVNVTGNMTDGFLITNQLKPGALKVTKAVTVDGADASTDATGKKYLADGTYNFTITGPKDYSKTGTITVTGGTATGDGIVLENLVPGEYTITESAAGNGTSLTERSGGTNSGANGIKMTVAPGSTAAANIAAFTNNINTTSLIINKTIVSPVPTDSTTRTFTFTVKVTKPDGTFLTGTIGGYEFDENGETTVTTTGNDSQTIQGLPQGAAYTVAEATDNDFDVAASATVTGTLGTTAETTAFTNTRKTGDLVITKDLRGKDQDDAPSGTYTYSVEVTTEIGGTTYYVAQSGGTYTLTTTRTRLSLQNGTDHKLTLTNLPVSHNGQALTYTVQEVNLGSVEVTGYTNVTVEGTTKESATASPGTAADPGTAALVNVYERDKGSLAIAKTVTVNGGTVPDTELVDGKYEFTVASNEGVSPATTRTVKITLTKGQISEVEGGTLNNGKAVISDLPTGTYTVTEELTEDQADRKKITFTASNNTSVSVTKDNTNNIPAASFVNNINVGSLKITKLVKIGETEVTAGNFTGDARKGLADGTYTFNVYSDSTATTPATKADGTAVGDVTVEIKDGVIKEVAEVTDLLPGTYYVKETGRSNTAVTLDTHVFEVTVEGGKTGSTVEAGATATATNVLPLGSLTITKKTYKTSNAAGSGYEPLSMTDAFPITVSVVLNGTRYYVQDTTGKLGMTETTLNVKPLTVSEGTHGTTPVLTISNLPYGEYTITESNPGSVAIAGYSYVNIDGKSQPSTDATVGKDADNAELVNVYIQDAEWTPEIVKLLNDTNYSGSDFSFTISIKGENNVYTQVKTATLATIGTVPFEAIIYPASIFDANSDPKEFIYKITEEPNASTDSNIVTDDTIIYAKVIVTKSSSNVLSATGTYYKDEACTQVLTTPTFRNYNKGGLTVTKETLLKEGDEYKDLAVSQAFPVTISVVLDGITYYVQDTNGTLGTTPPSTSLSVSASQSLVISNLKHGNYVVKETNPADVTITNYTYVEVNGKSKDEGSAVLSDTDESPTVALVNVYERDKGSLSIEKTVTVNGTAILNTKLVDGEYSFTVASKETAVVNGETVPVTTKNVTITITNGIISLVTGDGTLKDGKAVISNLPTGTYTVTENLTTEQAKFVTGTVSGSSPATASTEITVEKGNENSIPTASFVNDLKLGNLKITKKVKIGDNEAPTLAEPMKSLADGTYTFLVYSDDKATVRATKADGTVIDPVMVVIENGSVKEVKEVTDLLPGDYYVKESAGTNSAVMLDETIYKVTVEAGKTGNNVPSTATAEAVNTLPLGSLKVTKTLRSTTGETITANPMPEYPVTIMVTLDGTDYYVKDINGTLVKKTAGLEPPLLAVTAGGDLTISGLPYGTYSVAETEPNEVAITGYSYITVDGTSHSDATAEVSNITGTASLVNVYVKDTEWTPRVSKKLNGENYNGSAFSFTIEDITNTASTYTKTITNVDNGNVSFEAIPYKLADRDKTFTYEIVETEGSDEDIAYDTTPIYAKVTVNYVNGTLSATGKYYSDAGCTQELADPTIRNTELGTLEVTKTVTGAYTATEDDAYPFTVKSGNQYVIATISGNTYTYKELSDTDPQYTIPAGATLQFTKLPVGTYTVIEGSVTKTGYVVTTTYEINNSYAAGRIVTVNKGNTEKVEFINHYRDAELVITKTISGVEPSVAAPYITIKVTDNAGNILLEKPLTDTDVFTLSGSTYTATLKSTDYTWIVPDGVYTVTETMTDLNNYVLKSSTYAITAEKITTASIAVSGAGYTLQLTEALNATDHSTGQIDYTNTYEQPEPPHKKETDPYEGTGTLGGVQVGDEITYEISYKNYKTKAANVVINDKLDDNVSFVSASNGGKNQDGTVTWTLADVPAGQSGTVTLTVKVLEGALTSKQGPGKVVNGGTTATVKVGNDDAFTLETVENPVTEPHKKEVVPYEGNGVLGAVKVGEKITYEITYKNYKAAEADIVVKDTLDPHVRFVSASTDADAAGGTVSYAIVTNDAGAAVVCWTVSSVPAGKEGKVTLTVEVLESALESNGGTGKVINNGDTATVQVGNDKEITLETVENPVPEKPHKQETAPYNGNGILGAVHVGDEITYEITYKNYKAGEADIVITDTLDKNVSFVSASTDATAAGGTVSYTLTTNSNEETVITWTVKDVAAGTEGKVTVTVKVLETALVSGGGPGKVDNGGSDATVKVGDDPAFELEYVENPVFEKRETAPYEGNGQLGFVKIGEVITYELSYRNYKNDVATVTVTDKLDAHVELVTNGTTSGYTYDDNTRTLTWIIPNVPSGEPGTVVLKVKVLESALVFGGGPGKVVNEGASVQVGNDGAFTLEKVENPVPEPPHKQETGISRDGTTLTDGYTGNGTLGNVQVGDLITYEISYVNYKTTPAKVLITDQLDPHVAYAGSSNGGSHTGEPAGGTVTWTIENAPAGKEGKVTLTVRVLDTALVSNSGPGEVVNGGPTATVKIGDDNAYELEEVKNPVEESPHKKEISPYEGDGILGGVQVGDKITYRISYTNYKADKATVIIRDTLDTNVVFVSADNGGTLADGVVTWTIADVPKGQSGTVTLTVQVLLDALEENGGPGNVVNGGKTATVKVGNDHEFTLETVENPVIEPHKKETAPYEGNGVLGAVKVGDEITYEISYKNYKDDAATVTIKDKLDKNVAFVTASDSGKLADGVVTWTLADVPAGKDGKVTLTVKVLSGALESNDGPGKVVNDGKTATVQVGDDHEYTLETVENPVPEEPHKQETAPYEGNGVLGPVQVGDEITYEISYKNYKAETATVTIKDKLDRNVAFVSASDNGKATDGVVTWTLADVPAGKEGKVTLQVKVLPGAQVSSGGPGKVVNGGETATVQVGNDSEFTLETVENPVPDEPHKQETAPYEGNGVLGAVKVGDEITYEISYWNYKAEAVTVVVKDKLDRNVEFVSASGNGKLADGVVTWTLADVPAGKDGKVTLKVKVLPGALESSGGPGKVVNGGGTATVKVGNDSEFTLETVENPVPEEPHKKETAPYEGNGLLGEVQVDSEITYEISYKNYKAEAATVVIKDKLDPNVAFISADNGGKAADGVVTWTLADVPAGKDGKVTLTVRVLEGAVKSAGGPGKVVNGGETATVKVGNDSEFTLETVENPVPDGPHKKETAPYEGDGVLGGVTVGQEITYEITYLNYKTETAIVVIKDKLDKNVAFVSASDNGLAAGGTVTWILADVSAGKTGKVTLTVKVLESALESNGGPGKVVNGGKTATVRVGNDDEYTLETVENPVDSQPHKTEVSPYAGNGDLGVVSVGEDITYRITYTNYKSEAANVVIRDTLDPNVSYIFASRGSSYDPATHTVTWTLADVPAGKTGYVTLIVRVRKGALVSNEGPGKVVNGGDTATVKIGNDREITLETVTNPVESVSTTVVKTWDDADDAAGLRPAVVKVKLSNGDVYYLNEANGWTVTVNDLPKYDNGKLIRYTWTEQSVPGYTREVREKGDTTEFINHCVVQSHPKRPQRRLYEFDDMPTALGIGTVLNHVGDNFE